MSQEFTIECFLYLTSVEVILVQVLSAGPPLNTQEGSTRRSERREKDIEKCQTIIYSCSYFIFVTIQSV